MIEDLEVCPTCLTESCLREQRKIAPEDRCVLEHARQPCRPRRQAPGLYVCLGHRGRILRQLRELGPLDRALAERALVNAGPTAGARSSETRIPLNEPAARLRRHLRQKLAGTVRLLCEERHLAGPDFAGGRGLLSWLERQHDVLCSLSWVDDYATEISELNSSAWSIAYPSGTATIAVGRCPRRLACDVATRAEVEPCTGTVTATVRRGDDLLPAALLCDTCEAATPPHAWLTLGKQIRRSLLGEAAELDDGRPLYLTGIQLAELWSVPVGTVQYWAHEDGWDRVAGRPTLYLAADAQLSYDTRRGGEQLAV